MGLLIELKKVNKDVHISSWLQYGLRYISLKQVAV